MVKIDIRLPNLMPKIEHFLANWADSKNVLCINRYIFHFSYHHDVSISKQVDDLIQVFLDILLDYYNILISLLYL